MEAKGPIRVPVQVNYPPAWLTWVASTTGCLNALGVDCDHADVAGFTGMAFRMTVHETLCPSGPTAGVPELSLRGIACLGRSHLLYSGGDGAPARDGGDRLREHCRVAHSLAAHEIKAGRPCVIWGTYTPEFGIAVGVEGDSYVVETYRAHLGEPQPPIPYDGLEAPGGPYVLAFPARTDVPSAEADRYAVHHALKALGGRMPHGPYTSGVQAYDTWIAALRAGTVHSMGNSYNAQCWAEAKRFARDFLTRVAERAGHGTAPLAHAISAYADAAGAMDELAGLFPFPGSDEAVERTEIRNRGISALRAAKAAEAAAAEALAEAVAHWPTS